ncbi:alcohol dehydrogenase catalytic domain-containing protein [Rhabdothermincola salaria]|uniref:alcohol dehydrogenase catalytic domain-containing protein n=1 Tax=Rhabdothermincola salaria TaxID=2903142 RepID=UPI001E37F7DC|nr:alcohol dehydrogenase catalytic domain-containing protein [Rhabdothermincola salaria]MCD9624062.1 alcohol dehydrogenase catalytic domain-containing protein [Rhabdothermincola salaria]
MRAVRCHEGHPVVVDVDPPVGEGVRVTVASAGICGSDLHLLGLGLPLTFGHEVAGTLPDGTPVAVEPLAPCGVCPACVGGDHARCVLGPAIVLGVGLDGGMADQVLVPESAVARLPGGVALADASLVEPLAVAVHGVRRGGVGGGDRVAVVGGGTIGQMALVAAQAAGATVDLEARHDRQREAAARLGAGEVEGHYDVVVEAAGSVSALARAVDATRPGGTVVLLGSYWDGDVTMPGLAVTMKEVSLVPSTMYGRVGPSRDIDVAATILGARPDLADAVITHRFPLDAAAEAFAVAADRAAGAIKVVLEP